MGANAVMCDVGQKVYIIPTTDDPMDHAGSYLFCTMLGQDLLLCLLRTFFAWAWTAFLLVVFLERRRCDKCCGTSTRLRRSRFLVNSASLKNVVFAQTSQPKKNPRRGCKNPLEITEYVNLSNKT